MADDDDIDVDFDDDDDFDDEDADESGPWQYVVHWSPISRPELKFVFVYDVEVHDEADTVKAVRGGAYLLREDENEMGGGTTTTTMAAVVAGRKRTCQRGRGDANARRRAGTTTTTTGGDDDDDDDDDDDEEDGSDDVRRRPAAIEGGVMVGYIDGYELRRSIPPRTDNPNFHEHAGAYIISRSIGEHYNAPPTTLDSAFLNPCRPLLCRPPPPLLSFRRFFLFASPYHLSPPSLYAHFSRIPPPLSLSS
jgi:hypothetical protein